MAKSAVDVSKGSITPRTIRHTKLESFDLQSIKVLDKVISERNMEHRAVQQRKEFNIKQLKKLESYGDPNKMQGLLAAFEKPLKSLDKELSPNPIGDDNLDLKFTRLFQHRVEGEGDLTFSIAKPMITHYGINGREAMILEDSLISDGDLHPLEMSIFTQAINYLCSKANAYDLISAQSPVAAPLPSSPPVQNNVVLVSFFKRNEDKLLPGYKVIKVDSAHPNEVETHTTVLWKTKDKVITVIDPSNSTFSSFLYGMDLLKFQFVSAECGMIYKPNNHSYTKKHLEKLNKFLPENSHKYPRDCVDIAVKIAFELIEKQSDVNLRSVKEVQDAAVEQITNVNLPKEIGLFGALQSSDSATREAAKAFVDDLFKKKEVVLEKDKQGNPKTTLYEKLVPALDITKLETAEVIGEVSQLIGDLQMEDFPI